MSNQYPSLMKEYELIIADDHEVVIDGLKNIFEEHAFISVKKCVSNLRDLMPALTIHQYDLLILDINLNNSNSLKIVPEIKNKFEDLKIIAFTSYDTPVIRKKASQVGVDAFLTKNVSKEILLQTIIKCISNKKHKSFNNIIYKENPTHKDKFIISEILSVRELEVLKLVAQGYTSQRIAETLFISKHTVQWHRKSIISKLELQSAAEMVKFAHEHGIV